MKRNGHICVLYGFWLKCNCLLKRKIFASFQPIEFFVILFTTDIIMAGVCVEQHELQYYELVVRTHIKSTFILKV